MCVLLKHQNPAIGWKINLEHLCSAEWVEQSSRSHFFRTWCWNSVEHREIVCMRNLCWLYGSLFMIFGADSLSHDQLRCDMNFIFYTCLSYPSTWAGFVYSDEQEEYCCNAFHSAWLTFNLSLVAMTSHILFGSCQQKTRSKMSRICVKFGFLNKIPSTNME